MDKSRRHNVEQNKLNANDMIPFIKIQKEAKLRHGDRSRGYFGSIVV